MNKKTIITGFLTLILMGGNVLLATHGNDYSRELEGHESESDVEETKDEQAEDETAGQYRQRASQEAEAMRHDLEGDDTQASPFGSGLEDTTEEDLIYVVPSPDPSYVAHEPLITPKGGFNMPRNNLAYVGLGSEMPALQDQQVDTQQLSQEELNNQLIKAAYNGDLDSVKYLLERGANIEAADSLGMTPIIAAVRSGSIDTVELLLEHGVSINPVNTNGENVLISAIDRGYLRIFKLLLKHGADIQAVDQMGETALIHAARCGKLDIVKLLLEEGADINTIGKHLCFYGQTALIAAASNGYSDIIELLLEHGAEIETADINGVTVLMGAAYKGYLNVVELLLNKKVRKPSIPQLLDSLAIKDNALTFARIQVNNPLLSSSDLLSIIKLIMAEVFDCEWNLESLLDTAIKNNITASNFLKLCIIYQFLEKEEITVNEPHQSITYKLFKSAVLNNNTDALTCLFGIMNSYTLNINLNEMNEDGEGLLHIALRHGELGIIQVLLESGYAFDLELLNAEGETPLDIASKNGLEEIADYLASKAAKKVFLEDHPNPNAGEDEPPAKRRRVESGEEDEEDLNESIQDADAQDDQESIFAPSRTRKTRELGKFDA